MSSNPGSSAAWINGCPKLAEDRANLRREIRRQLARQEAGLPTDTDTIRRIKRSILDHHDYCGVCNA